jgi:hypothetical protein
MSMFTRPRDDEFVDDDVISYGTRPKGYGQVTIHQSPIKFPENTITFCQQDSTWVMRITADRRIEVNEGVEVTEAAQKVLDAMQHILPKREWVGLTKQEIRAILESNDWTTIPARLIWEAEAKLKEKNT